LYFEIYAFFQKQTYFPWEAHNVSPGKMINSFYRCNRG